MIAHILTSARYARILRLLDLERKVILNGPLSSLRALVDRREAAVAEVLDSESEVPEAFLAALKARAERNSRLILASLAGRALGSGADRADPHQPLAAPHLQRGGHARGGARADHHPRSARLRLPKAKKKAATFPSRPRHFARAVAQAAAAWLSIALPPRDLDLARLQRLGNLAHEVDVQQAVLGRASRTRTWSASWKRRSKARVAMPRCRTVALSSTSALRPVTTN